MASITIKGKRFKKVVDVNCSKCYFKTSDSCPQDKKILNCTYGKYKRGVPHQQYVLIEDVLMDNLRKL